MTPNEICREIVTRLQLGGGMRGFERQTEWGVLVLHDEAGRVSTIWDFGDLNHVAKAIRAVGDGMTYSLEHIECMGGDYRAGVGRIESFSCGGLGATEAEALTRALLEYLRANKIGEEHLTPPEPEEPWIDVSESVSTANLPEDGLECVIEFGDGSRLYAVRWYKWRAVWKITDPGRIENAFHPKALGGSVIKWRYTK